MQKSASVILRRVSEVKKKMPLCEPHADDKTASSAEQAFAERTPRYHSLFSLPPPVSVPNPSAHHGRISRHRCGSEDLKQEEKCALHDCSTMRLPIAVHPANHWHVQCLLLQVGLCADDVATAGPGQRGRRELVNMARRLAQSRVALEDRELPPPPPSAPRTMQEPPHKGKVEDRQPHAVAAKHTLRQHEWRAIAEALRGLSDCRPPLLLTSPETPEFRPCARLSAAQSMAFTSPARLVALHAPRTLLPPLPRLRNHHDPVTYDAAAQHAALLTRLLAPYGVRVSLTGTLRRGCPAAYRAELLLSLTEAATMEVEAVPETTANDGDASVREVGTGARRGTGVLHRDALTIPLSDVEPATEDGRPWLCRDSGERADGETKQQQQQPQPSRRTEQCSCADAFAAGDPVSPQVAFRIQRAISSLIQCGYVVAGSLPLLSPAFLSRRQPLQLTVRFDTRCPLVVPPAGCTDPTVLSRLRLHLLTFAFCPWQSHATRLLLLTGPPAFTAHVCLRALAHGIDLNLNGAFEAGRKLRGLRDAESGGGDRDAEDASLMARKDVVRVLVEDEVEVLQIAGLPVVDPLLRGAYCQVHRLR